MSNNYLYDLTDTYQRYSYEKSDGHKHYKGRPKKSADELYLYYDPIDPDRECDISFFVKGKDFPFGDIMIPNSFSKNEKSAIRKLFLALDGYLISVNFKPFIPLPELLHICVNTSGQKRLKKYRKDAFLSKYDLQSFTEYEKFETKCIGDVFNYRFAIMYNLPIEDYKLGRIPVEISDRDIEIFKESVRGFLPDDFELDQDELDLEVKTLIPCSSSMCIKDSFEYKSVCTGLYKQNENCVPVLDGKRIVVPINCENIRDAVMFTPITTSYLKVLDRLIMSLFGHNKWFTMIEEKELFLRRLRKFRKKHSFFVCFDFEKEGITKPRELIIAILSVINEGKDNKFINECINLFKNYNLTVDGVTESMPRGHGLGMANALTSVVIISLLDILLDEIQEESAKTVKGLDFDVLSFNDDTTISIDEESFIDFEEFFYSLCTRYSVRYKREKTFWGKEFVFCEEYSNKDYNNKESYYYSSFYTALMCVNITQAKQFVSSISLTKPLDELFYYIISEFGYEFYEDEVLSPLAFGGWFGRSIYKVDLSFYEKDYFTTEELSACLAQLHKPKRKKANHHPFQDYDPLLFFMPDVDRLSGEKGIQYWKQCYSIRQKYYKKYLEEDLDIDSTYDKFREGHLNDVLPWKKYRNRINVEDTIDINFDIWKSERPLIDYLIKDRPISYMIGSLGQYKQLSAAQRKERQVYIQSTSNILIYSGNRISANKTHYELEKSYWRPERVIAALAVLHPLENFYIPYRHNDLIIDVKKNYELEITHRFIEFMNLISGQRPYEIKRKLNQFLNGNSLPVLDLYNAFIEFHVESQQDVKTEEIIEVPDWDLSVRLLLDLKVSDLPNELTDSHIRLKQWIRDKYFAWYSLEVINKNFVPVLNSKWFANSDDIMSTLCKFITIEELNASGWFKMEKWKTDDKEIIFFPEIISEPTYKVLGDSDTGGLNQNEVPPPVTNPEIVITNDNAREESDSSGEFFDPWAALEDM